MSLPWDYGKDSEESQDLKDLLLDRRTENFNGERFWSFDTLCQILTRDRVHKALAELWPEGGGINTYIDQIAPVYATAQDAQGKRPVRPSSEPKRFLKVFAILVLLDIPERIKDFIESDVSDNDLPLYMDREQPHPVIHRGNMQSLARFHSWRRFFEWQLQVNVPFLEVSKDDNNWVDYKTAALPWRRVTCECIRTFNTRDFRRIQCVEIDPGSHSFHHLLKNTSFQSRYFAIKTIDKSTRYQEIFQREVSMLKHFTGLKHHHLVPILATFKHQDDCLSLIFPYEECDIYHYWSRHPGLLKDPFAANLDSLRWMSGQMLGLVSALDWIHNLRDAPEETLRHGHIQRDKILWFRSESDPRGTFAIVGFELPVSPEATSQSRIRYLDVDPPFYLAPDNITYNGHTGSCDIWTLGCFYLEMACWMFGGVEEIELFTNARRTKPTSFRSTMPTMPTFFDIPHENGRDKETEAGFCMLANHVQSLVKNQNSEMKGYVFIVKSAVTDRITALHNRSGCTEYMHDFLYLVEQQMLLINSAKRARSSNIVRALRSMHTRAQDNTGVDYILRPCRSPRYHPSVDSLGAIVEPWFLQQELGVRPVDPGVAGRIRSLGLGRTLSNEEIRLLDLLPGEGDVDIECTIRVVPVGTSDPYEALSYVWGEPSGSIPIKVADCEVKVTKNLYAALRQLRKPTTARTLWIDQLCINQWDIDEKAEQVQLMRDIYQRCSKCLIWLGEISAQADANFSLDDAQLALSFINDMAGVHIRPMSTLPPILAEGHEAEAARKAFRGLFMHGNSWWSRIWTVQEAILPPSATVVWGPLSIPWGTLRVAASNMCTTSVLYVPMEAREALGRHEVLIDNFMYPVQGLEISRKGESPLHMLHRWRYRGATEPRDKLFALMGLFPPIPGIKCSYNIPPGELFANMTLGLIELEKSLKPLIGLRGEPHVTPDLPSWALDLACYDYGSGRRPWNWGYHSHRYDRFAASGKLKPDFNGRFAKGFFVDSILEVGDVLGKETWDDLSDETLILAIKSWRLLLDRFVMSQKANSRDVYAECGSIDDAFWRTMLGNLILAEVPVSWASENDRSAYDAFLQHSIRNQVYESLRDMVINQAFFITTCGYIGLGPPNLRIGDEIWVLSGGQVPFVLRRHIGRGGLISFETDRRSFIGDAYVHGIMQGEVIETRHRTATLVQLE